MKITPARSASDGGEIVKIGLVRQPLSVPPQGLDCATA